MQLLLLCAALLTAVWLDRRMDARRLSPPGFQHGAEGDLAELAAWARRVVGVAALTVALWLGVLAPLASIGADQQVDLERLTVPQIFTLHAVFAVTVVLWWLAGYQGTRSSRAGRFGAWSRTLGWRARRPLQEVGLGALAGLLAWGAVIAIMLGFAAAIWALGADRWLPQDPPRLMEWIVGLPVWVRLAVAVSAGVVEETFFRGLLQPRVGIPLSTLLFVLAHLSWGQPFMLVGVTLLSLVFAALVRWRQSIWAAATAHAVFDAVQLLIVLPVLLEFGGAGGVA